MISIRCKGRARPTLGIMENFKSGFLKGFQVFFMGEQTEFVPLFEMSTPGEFRPCNGNKE